ncbi:MAG: asparagine synthase [Deltaproteobacteria bacterium]|nr:asparagine synthase [Deltaproteobacteria bacterium]
MPPATMLKCNNGHCEKRQYWSLRPRTGIKSSYQEALELIRLEIAESVKIRLRSDLPVGVLLSGGIDSSVVAYEAAQAMGGNVQTFTISNKEKTLDESLVAGQTAAFLGIRNETLEIDVSAIDLLEKVVSQFDQPFADSSAIPCFAISRLARRHVTVVLNGDGGDEIFAGYRRYVAGYYLKHIPLFLDNRIMGDCVAWLAGKVPRRSIPGLLFRNLRGCGRTNGLRYLIWTTDMLFEEDKKSLWIGKNIQRSTETFIEDTTNSGLSGLTWQMDADIKINLCSDLLVKMDMTTMASSLEARSPLLDHRLGELAASLPENFLIKNGRLKACLRDAYKEHLPREIIKCKKRGFEVPLDRWLKEDWKSIINDVVLNADAELRSFIDARDIQDIFLDKVFPDRNLAYVKYALLVLELWLRQRR